MSHKFKQEHINYPINDPSFGNGHITAVRIDNDYSVVCTFAEGLIETFTTEGKYSVAQRYSTLRFGHSDAELGDIGEPVAPITPLEFNGDLIVACVSDNSLEQAAQGGVIVTVMSNHNGMYQTIPRTLNITGSLHGATITTWKYAVAAPTK